MLLYTSHREDQHTHFASKVRTFCLAVRPSKVCLGVVRIGFRLLLEEGSPHRDRSAYDRCVCVLVLTGQVGLEASFGHELSDDVDRLSSGAHGQQLD